MLMAETSVPFLSSCTVQKTKEFKGFRTITSYKVMNSLSCGFTFRSNSMGENCAALRPGLPWICASVLIKCWFRLNVTLWLGYSPHTVLYRGLSKDQGNSGLFVLANTSLLFLAAPVPKLAGPLCFGGFHTFAKGYGRWPTRWKWLVAESVEKSNAEKSVWIRYIFLRNLGRIAVFCYSGLFSHCRLCWTPLCSTTATCG